MSQLNQIELQNLRHIIGAHETACQKMQSYAEQATDPQVKILLPEIRAGCPEHEAAIADVLAVKEDKIMFQEKVMVNDALASVKSSLTVYANTISECANPALRSAMQEIRDKCEASQYELYKIAQTKGYYKPAVMAKDDEVRETKMQLQG